MKPDWCAIFDWDGVVVDSSRLHELSWEVLAAREHRTLPPGHFKRGFGMKNEVVIPDVLQWAREPAEVERLARTKEALYRELVAEQGIDLILGTVAWLAKLRDANVRCTVASSTRRPNVDCVMDRMSLAPYFDAVVTGEDAVHGKPSPEIFLVAATRLGFRPDRCVVFEDSLPGVEAARAAGMKLVALTTTNPANLLGEADLVVPDFNALSVEAVASLFDPVGVRGGVGGP